MFSYIIVQKNRTIFLLYKIYFKKNKELMFITDIIYNFTQ